MRVGLHRAAKVALSGRAGIVSATMLLCAGLPSAAGPGSSTIQTLDRYVAGPVRYVAGTSKIINSSSYPCGMTVRHDGKQYALQQGASLELSVSDGDTVE